MAHFHCSHDAVELVVAVRGDRVGEDGIHPTCDRLAGLPEDRADTAVPNARTAIDDQMPLDTPLD